MNAYIYIRIYVVCVYKYLWPSFYFVFPTSSSLVFSCPVVAAAAACIERRERGGDFSCTTNVEPYEPYEPQDCMSVGETKDREVRAISQCQSTHGALLFGHFGLWGHQINKREREKKNGMNDGQPVSVCSV